MRTQSRIAAARGALLTLVLGALALPAPPPAAADDWPQYRGPERDGHSAERGIATTWPEGGPKVLWRADLGEGYSGIAVVAGRLYTLYGDGKDSWALCLDAASGERIWRQRLDARRPDRFGNGPRATPTVAGGTVYALAASGKLAALDAVSGEVRWRVDLVADLGGRVPTWGYSGSPLVDGPRLLVDVGGADGSSVVALDRMTGERLWATGSDLAGYSSPLIVDIAGQRQAVFFTGTGVLAVAPEDGRQLWRQQWKTSYDVNAATPIFVPPDGIFVSSGYDVGAALLRVVAGQAGVRVEEAWKERVMKNQFSSSVRVGGHIYGFDDSTFKCIAATSGEPCWRERGLGKGSLLVADGYLVVLGEAGQLVLAEATPEAYREVARAEVIDGKTWTMPTLADGRLFVRTEKKLVALQFSGAGVAAGAGDEG